MILISLVILLNVGIDYWSLSLVNTTNNTGPLLTYRLSLNLYLPNSNTYTGYMLQEFPKVTVNYVYMYVTKLG